MSGEKISQLGSAGALTGTELIPVVRVGNPDLNLNTTPQGVANFIETSGLLPAGVMLPFGGPAGTAPNGWLVCDGSAVSRSIYASLFAAIGVNYGSGNGSTTFNLPDLRGRTIAGFDPGNSTGRLTGAAAGGVSAAGYNAGGEQAHTLSTAELAIHNHSISVSASDSGHTHGVSDPGHSHGISDPGHVHGVGLADNRGPSGLASTSGTSTPTESSNVNSAATGITGNGANATGITGTGTGVANISASGSAGNAGSGSGHNNVQPTLIATWIIKV